MSLRLGIGVEKITPELGMPIYRGVPCQAVLDDLDARAVALESDGTRALVISCDLLEVEGRFTDPLCADIEAATGTPRDNIIVACSHSHSTPGMTIIPVKSYGPAKVGRDAKWEALLHDRLLAAARQAVDSLEDGSISAGKAPSRAGTNRRSRSRKGILGLVGGDPDGVIDADVTALALNGSDGRRRAVWVHYACHPVIYKSGGLGRPTVSRDFPGIVVDLLEEELGCPATFANGCQGDINPTLYVGDHQDAETNKRICYKTGEMIAEAALKAIAAATPIDTSGPAVCRKLAVDLEVCDWPDEEALTTQWGVGQQQNMRILKEMVEARQHVGPDGKRRITTALRGLRFGDVSFLGLPGEIFVEWGLMAKELSPAAFTLPLSNANDYMGYVPTRQALEEGGMGTVLPMFMLAESAPDSFEQALRELI